MATILDQYYQTKQQVAPQIEAGNLSYEYVLRYQELLYRISILESCMTFCKTAPVTDDLTAMSFHYQVVDALITCMLQERQFGIPADEKLKKQRSSALNNLQVIVNSFRKQFKGFAPTSPQSYKEAISRMINTILNAWLQYRHTYVPF